MGDSVEMEILNWLIEAQEQGYLVLNLFFSILFFPEMTFKYQYKNGENFESVLFSNLRYGR